MLLIIQLNYIEFNNYPPLIIKPSLKDIFNISVDVSNIQKAKGSISEIAKAIKGLTAEQAVYRMELADCSEKEMIAAMRKNKLTQADIKASLAKKSSTIATTADKVATDADTASKYANLKVTNLLKVAWAKFSAFAMANPWLVGIVAGALAIAGLAKIYDALTLSVEEASEATKEAISELSSISSEVETLEGKIADLKSQIDGLNPITDAEDIANLKAETQELENQLAILKEKERIASEEADKAAQESLGKTQGSRYQTEVQQVTSGYAAASSDGTIEIATQVTREEELQNAMNAHDEYYKQRLALEAELAKMSADDEGYKEKESQIQLLNQQMTDARTHANELALALEEEKDGLNGVSTESKELLDSTNATLSSYNEWLGAINNTTDALNENASAIDNTSSSASKFTKSKMIDTINGMSDGFDILDKIYADILDKGTFDFTNLDSSKFTEAFSGLEEEYASFIETVSASPNDIDACQTAFNELTDAYIRQNDILDNLTEENAQLTIDMLKNMGVINAEEVVMSALGATFADYATAKRECALAGIDLLNATNEEIIALINENKVSQATAHGLFLYQVQKALANQNGINTVEDCIQLENLALAAGYAGSAVLYIAKIKGLLNKIDSENLVEGTLGYKDVMGQVNTYNNALQKLLSTEKKSSISMANYSGATKSAAAAQKNLSDATDKANDALKKQIEVLEKQKEALEEEKAEMEELHDAIMWFYDEQIEEIDDKIEAIEDENEAYKDQIEVIDKQIKAIEKQIETCDKQIETINDKIDALNKENDALGEQQENMDDILSAIENNYDTEIKLIQDKIDALQDANDEEERALQLEEAKRKLLEAKSRKTLQVYSKGQGFVYTVDSKAIKEAESELEDLQDQAVIDELQKQIDKLEEAKQKWSEIPEAYEKAMQEIAASQYFGSDWKNITLFPSEELLEKFGKEYSDIQSSIDANEDAIEKHEEEKERIEEVIQKYDELIEKHEEEKECINELIAKNEDAIEKHEEEKERINELKELWEDAKNAYIEAEYERQLNTFFGSDYEYQLLNNSQTWREKYAEEYGEVCQKIEELETKIKTLFEQTGNKAQTAAGQVRDYKASLGELDGSKAETEIITTYVTKNVVLTSNGNDTTSAPSTSNTGRPGMTNIPSLYAKGTRNAKKGIAEVAEEGAEIITDGETVFLAETPTLVNMQGGETVYNAKETEQILAGKGLQPLDASFFRNVEAFKSTMSLENFTANQNYSVPQFVLPKYDFSNLGMANRTEQTVVQINGNIELPNIKSGDDAKMLINELSNLSNKALQRANRRN